MSHQPIAKDLKPPNNNEIENESPSNKSKINNQSIEQVQNESQRAIDRAQTITDRPKPLNESDNKPPTEHKRSMIDPQPSNKSNRPRARERPTSD